LTGGVNVEQRELQRLLTETEFSSYLQQVEAAQSITQYQRDESEAFTQYVAILKKADFAYGRSEYYARTGKKRGKERMEVSYTKLYEVAYEHLTEILSAQPHLYDWLDRDFSSEPEIAPTASKNDAPRVITSKSHQNQARTKAQQQGRQDCKTDAVADALYALRYESDDNTAERDDVKQQLDRFLQLPDDDAL
jgi:hypothetical protein